MTESIIEKDRTVAATTGGAIGLSAFASFVGLCCIGPWAVALLGVSGAVAMARWQPLRPYILVLAAIMMAWAFWRVYRPKFAGGGRARSSIRLQTMLWLSAILLGLAFFADGLQVLLIDPTPEALRK